MYTGIVDHLGEIIGIKHSTHGMHLIIQCNFDDIILGESIAIDGICVTVVKQAKHQFECDLSPETLKLTTAKLFQENQKINLERSLQLNDRLGGHFVMGHVDTTATVAKLIEHADFTEIDIDDLTKSQMQYIVKKGSVCVNGISLTINDVWDTGFNLMIIPHTKQVTNIQFWQPGQKINIEFDSIARVVVDQMQRMQLTDRTINVTTEED